jgi:hypothetical protein
MEFLFSFGNDNILSLFLLSYGNFSLLISDLLLKTIFCVRILPLGYQHFSSAGNLNASDNPSSTISSIPLLQN